MNLSIIVEGLNDVRFLQDFIQYHFNKKLGRDVFIDVGGKTEKLFKSQEAIQASTDQAKSNILIFDADDKDFESTSAKLNAKCEELNLSIEKVFLFPNDQAKGNLEALLMECVPPSHKTLFGCINDYQSCKSNTNISGLRKTDLKEAIRIYHGSFEYTGKAIATHRNYLQPHVWNLNSPSTTKLKEFLNPYFQ